MNALHFVLKSYADEEFVSMKRMLCHMTDVEIKEHSRYTTDVLSPADNRLYMAQMADGWYAELLAGAVGSFSSVSALSRCGLRCNLSPCEDMAEDTPELLIQDAVAHQSMDFLLCFMRARVASCAWHSHSLPGLSSLLLHPDQAKVTEGLRLFKEYVLAWEWARQCGSAAGVDMAGRSMLHGKLLVALVRLARITNFESVNVPMSILLNNMWTGFLQTVINERMNKELRGAETRSSTSKDLARLKRWEACRHSGQMEHYGVRMKPVDHTISVPTDVDLNVVFKAVNDASSVDLKRIHGKQDWETWNSMSIRKTFAEQQLMVKAQHLGTRIFFQAVLA